MSSASPPNRSHGRKSITATLKPRELMTPTPKLDNAWDVQIITLFPESFPGVLGHSLTGKALSDGKWTLRTIDLRDFGLGKHKNVDDTPAGGGAGLVIRADVLGPAIDHALNHTAPNTPLVYLSPRGDRFDQKTATKWSKTSGLILICGRFEGIDQRVIDHYNIQEISLGDFVLTGGEIAAQAMIDASLRLRDDILGNEESIKEESHSNGLLEHPQYTRPSKWQNKSIPEVLLSGHHKNVAKWRIEQSQNLTKERRPDLWEIWKNNTSE